MHYAAGLTLLVVLGLTVADITLRTGFNDPISGTVEVTALLLLVLVFLGVAYSEDLGDHIAVDLVYERIGPRSKQILDVFAGLLSVFVMGLMAFQIYHFALRQRDAGAETPVLAWPLWPFALVAAFGSLLYALAIASKLILRALGEPTEVEPTHNLGEAEVKGPEI